MTERKRVSLNLDFDDDTEPDPIPEAEKPKKVAKKVKAQVTRDAADSGFTSRKAPEPKIDGRTLRKTDRTAQLNIGISPATKDRFWQSASDHGHKVGGEFIEFLLELADREKRKSRD